MSALTISSACLLLVCLSYNRKEGNIFKKDILSGSIKILTQGSQPKRQNDLNFIYHWYFYDVASFFSVSFIIFGSLRFFFAKARYDVIT